ncbi:LysR substrate-binding domain-containing protein [Roseateles violae]|uniref:LysR substrate-binding domain-containing protein n=1 Tax=Roseateles violae TaxID=3058042 RepID=A0ABT8DU63_9BURK|nr:LysR substrate-binding domain-containing protein [Pelomonas sp. PFR6]MDN3920593.1 LysR substrate-binding domain-containing protein [Pelomonas sp. PFR6]
MSDTDRVLRSNLKLRHLQLLVALDEFRHIGRAAEFLSVTQPAVSKTLAEIERMFDLALFSRSTRGTEPTPYGASVVRFARSVLADYDRTRDEIAAVASGAAGRTHVGAMVVAMPGLLSDAIARLKAQSAQTSVLVEEGDLTRLLPRLRVGELDLIVGRLEPGYAAPDLETEALYEEGMAIVVRPEHPLRRLEKPPGWAELAGQAWVVPPPWASSRIKLNQMFYQHGLNPPVDLIETASFLATLCAVRERGCVGFVASQVARHFEREGLLATLDVEVPIALPPVGIITMRGRMRTPASEQLIACLRDAVDGLGARP